MTGDAVSPEPRYDPAHLRSAIASLRTRAGANPEAFMVTPSFLADVDGTLAAAADLRTVVATSIVALGNEAGAAYNYGQRRGLEAIAERLRVAYEATARHEWHTPTFKISSS